MKTASLSYILKTSTIKLVDKIWRCLAINKLDDFVRKVFVAHFYLVVLLESYSNTCEWRHRKSDDGSHINVNTKSQVLDCNLNDNVVVSILWLFWVVLKEKHIYLFWKLKSTNWKVFCWNIFRKNTLTKSFIFSKLLTFFKFQFYLDNYHTTIACLPIFFV